MRRKRTSGRRSGRSSRKRGGSARRRGSVRESDAIARGRRSARGRGSESEIKTVTAGPEIERETGSGTGSQTEARSTAPSAVDPGEHTSLIPLQNKPATILSPAFKNNTLLRDALQF